MGLKKFKNNIKFLYKRNLKHDFDELSLISMDDLLDNLKYELKDEIIDIKVPKIYSLEESVDIIVKSNVSLSRFGDGELNLICRKDIPLQKASEKLSYRLSEVLSSNNDKIMIGIPWSCYHSKSMLTDINKNFWRVNGPVFRQTMSKHINYEQQYCASELTLVYSYLQNYDYAIYFNNIRKIWNNKEIAVICGK